jgi:hypothetical protein
MRVRPPIVRNPVPLWTPWQAFIVGVGTTILVMFAALITYMAIWAY